MLKIFLIFLITFLDFWGMNENTFGQELYKWVDEKGTVHFSDNPTSGAFNPQGKQTSKENTNEILKGIEIGNRHISKDQLLLYHQKSTEEAVAERQLKAIKDQQEERQLRRDRAADMLEKEARKTKTVRDYKGNIIGSGMTKGQQEMLRDAARLRSGSDLEASPPPSDDVQKLKNKARAAEGRARQAEMDAESKTRNAEIKARRAEREAEDAERRARNAERRARDAEMWR